MYQKSILAVALLAAALSAGRLRYTYVNDNYLLFPGSPRQNCTADTPVNDVAFSCDGKYLLGNWGDQGDAKLWDIGTGGVVRSYSQGDSDILRVAISPDGKTLITSSAKVAVLWDTQTGAMRYTFPHRVDTDEGGLDLIQSVAFSPDGKYVLIGSGLGGHLHDSQTGADLRTFASTMQSGQEVQFSPDGRYILTEGLRGATGQNVTLWDTQAGTPIHSFARTYQGSMSPDGRYILTYGEQQGFVLWDAHNYSYVRSFVNADNSPAVWFEFSGDSRYVLVESLDQLVSLWGVNTGSKLHTFDRDILSGWFLPNSEAILTFGYATQENQTHYQVWNAKTLREQFRFDGPFPELLRLSPDGRFVIIESSDLELSMWSLQTGRKVRQFCG